MLETTLGSLARFAPANATLAVRADVPTDLMQAAHACLKRRVALRTLSTILFEAHEAPPIHACNSSKQRAIEHRNEREAAYLLKSVDDDEWVEADVAVLWRIDTELVSPIEAPARRRARPAALPAERPAQRPLPRGARDDGADADRRAGAAARGECVYGERRSCACCTRSTRASGARVVRVRADGFVPDIDKPPR